MFGKRELVDTLKCDLARARNKRDTLASSVTTLTAQIAELEVRLSAETARQARERAASVPLALASACSIRNPMELRRMTLKQFGFYE